MSSRGPESLRDALIMRVVALLGLNERTLNVVCASRSLVESWQGAEALSGIEMLVAYPIIAWSALHCHTRVICWSYNLCLVLEEVD